MLLEPTVFVALYEKLWKLGLKNERDNQPFAGAKSAFTKKLWYHKDKPENEGGESFFLRKFKGHANGSDAEYFYRIYNNCQTKIVPVTIDDLSLYKALKYLGLRSPTDDFNEEVVNPILPTLNSLLLQFIRENAEEINTVTENQGIKLTGKSLVGPPKFQPLEEPLESETDDLLPNIIADEVNQPQPGSYADEVKRTVITFYEAISRKHYQVAWKCLTPDFQRRVWGSVFEKFELGYINNNGLRRIHVFHITPNSDSVMDCQVYYEDEMVIYTTNELNAIALSTVGDLKELVRNITKLQDRIEKGGGKNFHKIELYKMMEPTAADYIWYTCGFNADNIGDVFHVDRVRIVKRLLLCTCHKVGGEWLLQSIRELKTYSLR